MHLKKILTLLYLFKENRDFSDVKKEILRFLTSMWSDESLNFVVMNQRHSILSFHLGIDFFGIYNETWILRVILKMLVRRIFNWIKMTFLISPFDYWHNVKLVTALDFSKENFKLSSLCNSFFYHYYYYYYYY